MVTSRFQLGLIATLAVGLGLSLSSSEAVGYPAGPVVSLGANPVWSDGGLVAVSGTKEVLTVPVGQTFIVTTLSDQRNSMSILENTTVVMPYQSRAAYESNLFSRGRAHLQIDGGATLKLQNNSGYSNYYYIEGYYAQP
jgi:hypothetical protein